MRVVLILVDALKSEYLTQDSMPFLYSLAYLNLYVKEIVPGVGFCERSELMTGKSPATSGNFTAIGFDPVQSEYQHFTFFAKILQVMDAISHRLVKVFLRYYCKKTKKNMKPYLIPPISLKNYTLTEDGAYNYEESDESLLSLLKDAGKGYSLSGFTSLKVKQETINPKEYQSYIMSNNNLAFIPLYYGDIDAYGHILENDSYCMKEHLKKLDKLLSQIYSKCIKNTKDVALVVLGDHGMIPVKQTIDIKSHIDSLRLKLGRDYEMFLDSTLARFWCDNLKIKELIMMSLKKIPLEYGSILSEKEAVELGVPVKLIGLSGKRLYGDILWYANAGTIISPDYFNPTNKSIRGMHGYLKVPKRDGCGLFVAAWNGCFPNERALGRLVDVCPTLCDLLEIKYPNNCEGKSLL